MSVIPQTPRASGASPPWASYKDSAGDIKRSPDPSPTHAPPLTTNPRSAPDYYMVLLALSDAVSLPLDTPFQMGNFLVFGQFRVVHVKYSRYLFLSVICVVFL